MKQIIVYDDLSNTWAFMPYETNTKKVEIKSTLPFAVVNIQKHL